MRTPFRGSERTAAQETGEQENLQKATLLEPNEAKTETEKVEIPENSEVPENKAGTTDVDDNIVDDDGNDINEGDSLPPNKTFVLNGIEYKTDDNGKVYCIDGETFPNTSYVKNGHVYETDSNGKLKSIDGKSIEEYQDIADKAAQEYNEKYKPYNRAIDKGVEGVRQTKNGGVSFSESDSIYTTEDGKKAVVKIEATGNRNNDFDKANAAMGLDEEPDGYVWHHVDDYDVKDNTITMELVKDEAHNASKPHSGGCAQYDSVNGSCYNPPKKEQSNG